MTKLDDDAALKKAADFMGEVFIFAVAGVAVAYEVAMSKSKDDAKVAALRADKDALQAQFGEVGRSLREVSDTVAALDARVVDLELSLRREQRRKATRGWWPFAMGAVQAA
jgi:hypothetical protein